MGEGRGVEAGGGGGGGGGSIELLSKVVNKSAMETKVRRRARVLAHQQFCHMHHHLYSRATPSLTSGPLPTILRISQITCTPQRSWYTPAHPEKRHALVCVIRRSGRRRPSTAWNFCWQRWARQRDDRKPHQRRLRGRAPRPCPAIRLAVLPYPCWWDLASFGVWKDPFTAALSRERSDANVLCLSADLILTKFMRLPTANADRSSQRAASEKSGQGTSSGTFRSTRVLGVRRRHARR